MANEEHTIALSGNSIMMVGGRIIVDGVDVTNQHTIPDNVLRIELVGKVENIKTDKAVSVVGDVLGDIEAGGSVNCNNVQGNVQSNGSINCDNIAGDAHAGGSVKCDDIGGNVRAGGSVRADVINGKKE